jgi:uncharacterized protein
MLPPMRSLLRLAAVALFVGVAPAQAAVERPFPTITVNGEATAAMTPDLAQATVGVTTDGKSVREASDANAQAMTAVVSALKQAGLTDESIQTAQLSIQPVYTQNRPNRPEEPRITGYRVSNQVRIKLREIGRISEVVDRAIAAGATDLHGISFTIAEPSKALDATRAAAIEDAHRKAEAYAKAAGAQVGRAVDISESGPGVVRMEGRSAAMAAATPISPGETTLRVVVSVTYELLQ